jgi:hypothetical protein
VEAKYNQNKEEENLTEIGVSISNHRYSFASRWNKVRLMLSSTQQLTHHSAVNEFWNQLRLQY